MPPINIMIKPASSLCNLRCKYCFYFDTADNREVESYGIMKEETLENVIKEAVDFAEGHLTVAFQGGEPTLAGLDFYKKYIEIQKKYKKPGLEVHNALQTNGFVIDDEWAKFFKENNFLIGVSLDGTKECHDAFRVDNKDKGSFKRVMEGIESMKKYKVDFNILCVVNSVTAKKIQSVYNFYKKNQFEYLQFIPCLQPFNHEGDKMPFTLSAKDWGTFLCNLFDIWYRDFTNGNPVHIRQFENYIEMILGYPPESCGMSGICSWQNIVEADGSCYPCDFYVLDKYKLGNFNENNFNQINEKRKELKFVENSSKIHEKCLKCRHVNICRGGCKRYCEPFTEDDSRDLNILCEGYMKFFDHSYERLRGLATLFLSKINK